MRYIKNFLRFVFSLSSSRILVFLARLCPFAISLFPQDNEYQVTFYKKLQVIVCPIFAVEKEIMSGRYETDVISIIEQFVRPGMTVMDVGANVGALSVVLADRVGETGKVFSFEPGPNTFSRLKRNLSMNSGIDSVVIPQNMGCAQEEGVIAYHELSHSRGNAILGELDKEWHAYESHEVKVVAIDSFVRNNSLNNVDFMKVDVERMEFDVLLGAKEMIKKFHPVICYETLSDMGRLNMTGGENFRRIEEMLTPLGYTLYRIEDGKKSGVATPENYTLNTLAVYEE